MTEQVPQSGGAGTPVPGSTSSASYSATTGASASAATPGAAASSPTSATVSGTAAANGYPAGASATGYTASGYPTGTTAGSYPSAPSQSGYATGTTAGGYRYPSAPSQSGYTTGTTAGGYSSAASTSAYPSATSQSSYATGTTAGSYPSATSPSYAGATTPLPPVTPSAHGYVQPYGSVAAAQAESKKSNTLLGVVIGLLVVILLAGAGTAFVFASGILNPPEEPAEEMPRAPLTDDQVIAAFDAADMTTPSLAQYAYVSQEALSGPRFSDIVVNEPLGTTATAGQVVECSATATATFQNKGIEISAPVTLPFEYNPISQQWIPGQLMQGNLVTTPLASPSAPEIVANLNQILMGYDPTYGESMADATVVKTTAKLSIDGGTIVVDLTKTVEDVQEDKTINELRTCTDTLTVSWDNNKGWLVTVTDAGEIDTKVSEIPKVDEAPALDPGVVPDQMGTVQYGDTVKLTGTLEAVGDAAALSEGNGYTNDESTADASGLVQLVLRLSTPIDLTLGGTQYRLTTVAIAVYLHDNGASLIGRTAEVEGKLQEDCATSWCPFGMKAENINLTA